MKNEYAIINKTFLEEKIQGLKNQKREYYEVDTGMFDVISMAKISQAIDLLTEILSQSTPLIIEIGKAFDSARKFNSLDGVVDINVVVGFHSETKDLQGVYINSEDYISNLKLDI